MFILVVILYSPILHRRVLCDALHGLFFFLFFLLNLDLELNLTRPLFKMIFKSIRVKIRLCTTLCLSTIKDENQHPRQRTPPK
jgi:hypothetical protein